MINQTHQIGEIIVELSASIGLEPRTGSEVDGEDVGVELEGVNDGTLVVGSTEGLPEGDTDGAWDGSLNVGEAEGVMDGGVVLGEIEGLAVRGAFEGEPVGHPVGEAVGVGAGVVDCGGITGQLPLSQSHWTF